MSGILSDLKYALRTLRKTPLFTFVAVISLALGIGANTAIFTLVDQLMLRLLPVKDPEQLVMIWSTGPHMGNNRGSRAASYPMYEDFQKNAPAFSHVFCRFYTPLSISVDNQTERVNAELVSGNYFQALGVKPAIGRVFSPEEDDRVYKGHPTVVLSHDYWVSRFSGRTGVIGQKVLVNNYPMTIVGVSAPGFTGLDPSHSPQIRVPIQMKPLMTPGWDAIGDRRSQWIQMFARMKPGFTVESARASLQPLFSQILQDEITQPKMREVNEYYRKRFLARKVQVESAANGYSQLRRQYDTALIVLMCMVGLVLLIACANVANLLIARAVARQKEIAVRLAIGASRARLLRQLLLESMLLAVAGGVGGVFLAIWTTRALLGMLPADGMPLMLRAEPDLRILAFNLALACATGLLFGLVPALQSTRPNLWNTLKDVVGAVSGGGGSVRLRKTLVTAQVALSFLLLAGAGLFVKSLSNLKNTHTGFQDMANLVTFQIDPALNGYELEPALGFNRRLLDHIRALPGVRKVAYASVPLLHGWEWDSSMSVEGHVIKDGEDMQAFMNSTSPGYFDTMGIPFIEGRDFRLSDFQRDTKVAIVNRRFAEHFFGKESAVGRRIGFGRKTDAELNIEIIGVVENSLYEGPRDGIRRQAFIPHYGYGGVTFYVRSGIGSTAMYGALRGAVKQLDATLPVYEMKTLEGQLDETLATERLIAALSAAFGLLATLLAAVGLYGLMAFSVARRTKEIGLRMALGANQGTVIWFVLREVLALLAIGLAIGIPAAYGLSRYVASQLYNMQATDLQTALTALLLLAAVAIAAGFLPARRASAIDPLTALRYE